MILQLASLRTTVAINTCLLYCDLAVALGPQLDPHVDALLTNLLKMGGFTKKLTAQQSQTTVSTIITNTSAQPRVIIPLLWVTSQEKIVQARAYVVGHIKLYLEHHGHRAKNAIEASNHVERNNCAIGVKDLPKIFSITCREDRVSDGWIRRETNWTDLQPRTEWPCYKSS